MSVTFYSTNSIHPTDANCDICLGDLKVKSSIFNIFRNSTNLEHRCPPCGTVKHTFHTKCLTTWFETCFSNRTTPHCPTCKRDAIIKESLLERVKDIIQISADNGLMISMSWGAINVLETPPSNFLEEFIVKCISEMGKLHGKGTTTIISAFSRTLQFYIQSCESVLKTVSNFHGIKILEETSPLFVKMITVAKHHISFIGKTVQSFSIKMITEVPHITFLTKNIQSLSIKRASTAFIATAVALGVAIAITKFQKIILGHSYIQQKIHVLPLIYLGFLFFKIEEFSLLSVYNTFLLLFLCTNALFKYDRLRYQR